MELTPDITKMFRTKYETKWEVQIQQDVEIIKPFVTIHPNCFGKSVELPYHGTAKMREYSGRLQKIQWSEMDFGKRSIKPRKFYDSIPLSEDDKLEMGTLDVSAGSFQLIPADFVAKGTKTASGMLIDKIAELRCRYKQIHWRPGRGDDFLGVKFLITNMLPLDEAGSRMCVAWLKSRVKFGV